jgi:hypothetical protein
LATGVPARLSPREARRFGLEVGTAFAVLGALVAWRGHAAVAVTLGTLAGLLITAALAWPARLGAVHRAWMRLAALISRITTPLVLGVVYFAVITPTALARRLIGGNPLTHGRGKASYWVSRAESQRARDDMEHQF